MDKFKVVLNDGTEIYAADVSIDPHFTVNAINKEAVMDVWNLLTPNRLVAVKLMKNEITVGTFYYVSVIGVQFVPMGDGTVAAHFYLSGSAVRSDKDDEYVKAAKILLGEEE